MEEENDEFSAKPLTSCEKSRKNRERIVSEIGDVDLLRGTVWMKFVQAVISMRTRHAKHRKLGILFSPDDCSQIIDRGKWYTEASVINFEKPYLKDRVEYKFHYNQEPVAALPLALEYLELAITICFPNIRHIRFSLIWSGKNCNQQPLHADEDAYYNSVDAYGKRRIDNAPYSIIFALEDNSNPTSLDLDDHGKRKNVKLPQGSGILLRGDCRHAGVAYDRENYRLFVALGSDDYPNRGLTTGALNVRSNGKIAGP